MERVTSRDGTVITFDRLGNGPAVVLISGGSVDKQSNAPLAQMLAPFFSVYNYDRRGRGESGDTPPYAVEREIEDLDAVIGAVVGMAGGQVFVYGSSSGAALALEAARSGLAIAKLGLWEPPYSPDENSPRPPADSAAVFTRLTSEGRRGDAVEYFMSKVVGLPPEFVAQARSAPWWAAQEALAHTLAYDATIMGDYLLPADRLRTVTTPALVMAGGASWDWMRNTAKKLAEILPNGEYLELPGQSHDVSAEVLAPALTEYFTR
jgi:pimeloyl-ACP methyl ester carboxylesterase